MTYRMCECPWRVLPAVTFVLIFLSFDGKFVCARPQGATSIENGNLTTDLPAANITGITQNRNVGDVALQDVSGVRSDINSSGDVEIHHGTPISPIYGDISVNSGLDFGRAAVESTTKTSNVKQSTQPSSGTDMIITDIRTPPKIKSQIAQAQLQNIVSPGKGEAIPVMLEDHDEAALEKISADNFKYTHSDPTPSSGISTWILLNSDSVSTPFTNHKKVNKPVTDNGTTESSGERKKPGKPGTSTEKLETKLESLVNRKPERKPTATIQKVNQTNTKRSTTPKIEIEDIQNTTSVPLQDSKFKSKTPVIVGKIPLKDKIEPLPNVTSPIPFIESSSANLTRMGTPVVTFPHVPIRQRVSTTKKPMNKPYVQMFNTTIRTSIQDIATTLAANTDTMSLTTIEPITELSTQVVTKRNQSKKKKKKNKNKRRKTNKNPAKIESKISDDDNSTSKLPSPHGSRPLSTRIYNYLAREVMPNVGVGIVGLMLTAGLAGLLLYPFGAAVPVRRNYEKPMPAYNLNDYPPVGEVDNAQPEESVLSQVLAGMSNTMNQYSREQPDLPFKSQSKYKPARFDNAGSYEHAPIKYGSGGVAEDAGKFSELGDVVSGPHESVKFTSFDINDSVKYPNEAQPSPSYSTIDLTSQNDQVTYGKRTEGAEPVKPSAVYSTLGEYASYNNPSEPIQNPVYNGDLYDFKNHKVDNENQEFKVTSELIVTHSPENQTTSKPKHEPSFAALEGIPKNYRTLEASIRFEDPTVSGVLPMNQDFMPSEGVFGSSMEHGPRNIKIRRKRNTASENEIDSVLIDSTDRNVDMSSSPAPVQFILPENTENSRTTTINEESTMISTTELTDMENMNTIPNVGDKQFNEGITKPPATIFITPTNEIDFTNKPQILDTSTNYITSENTSLEVSSTLPTFKQESHPVIYSSTRPNPMLQSSAQTQPFSSSETISSSQTQTSTSSEKTSTQPALKYDRPKPSLHDCENCGELSDIGEPPSKPAFSLSSVIRKILDIKIRVGLELIRAASEFVGRYFSTVQQRMMETFREIQKSASRITRQRYVRDKTNKRRDRRRARYYHS